MQKTCWYSRAHSGTFWCFGHCRSQSSWWEKLNRGTIIDMQWWYKIWQRSGYNLTLVKQELPRKHKRACRSSWRPKVIHTGNSLEFGKLCEDLSWNQSASTPHRSETDGIAGRAVRRVTNGGRIPWSVTAICETFKISCLMGRHHMKGGSECPSADK